MWECGACTIRDLRDRFDAKDRPSPSAFGTAINAMIAKGLVRIADDRRPQKFEAVATRERTYASFIDDLRKRVFGGSMRDLVKHALGGRKQSAAEVRELRRLVDELGDTKNKKR